MRCQKGVTEVEESERRRVTCVWLTVGMRECRGMMMKDSGDSSTNKDNVQTAEEQLNIFTLTDILMYVLIMFSFSHHCVCVSPDLNIC